MVADNTRQTSIWWPSTFKHFVSPWHQDLYPGVWKIDVRSL